MLIQSLPDLLGAVGRLAPGIQKLIERRLVEIIDEHGLAILTD